MRILFLSSWFPYPPNNGSKLRIYHLLRELAQQHEVTLISFADPPVGEVPYELNKLCRQVYVLPARPYHASSPRALLGLFQAKPRVLVDRYVPEMDECIHQELNSGKVDLVVASQWYMAAYLDGTSPYAEPVGAAVPAIFEEAEIGVFQDKVAQAGNPLRQLRHRLTNLKMQRYFRSLLAHFAACTVASEAERSLLQSMVPGYTQVEVIPNGVRVADYTAVREPPVPETMIFTGSFRYGVNHQAMQWFVGEVLPLIQAEAPHVRLTITGDPAGKELPPAKNVTLTGFVDDIRPLVAASWVSLAPLLSGGGTRLKILEAMALRSPVVATSKGAEGLDAQPGKHLLIADTPQEFAAAVLRLMSEPGLRRQIVNNAYHLVREKYDWPVIMPQFLNLVQRIVPPSASAGLLPPVLEGETNLEKTFKV